MELQAIRERVEALRAEIHKVVIGQDAALDLLLTALLSDGHVLVEGVPGTAKTLLARAFAAALGVGFNRIQFTPDLMPGDVLGTNLFDFRTNTFQLTRGPVFTDVLVADEINRTPPKTQAALLQAMQERAVTIDGVTYPLPPAFLVIATQNPIEQEGTYPLPEAQVDRFMLKVKVGYPTREEERAILDRMAVPAPPRAAKVVGKEELALARATLHKVYVDDRVKDYIVNVVFATRDPRGHGLPELAGLVEWGASPRATLFLVLAAKAHAFLRRRAFATPEDVKAVAYDVLRHRITLTYEAEAEELTPEKVVSKVLDRIEVP
jgi:MoxR-like ATPase